MLGRIVSFNDTLGQGVIAASDGRRFRFSRCEVVNPNGKFVGYDVDFIVESRRPQDIIVLAGSLWSVFSRTQAA